MNIPAILVSLIVTTIAFLIISKLPVIGVEIDSVGKAIIAAIVFGVLNAILHPILDLLAAPLNFVTFGFLRGLITLIINGIIFGLSAFLVRGFRLRSKIWSPFLGAFALTIINSIIYKALGAIM